MFFRINIKPARRPFPCIENVSLKGEIMQMSLILAVSVDLLQI